MTSDAAPAASARPLSLRGLRKRFAETQALDGVDLEVAAGEVFTLLGPSGCGKTTLLRAVAGFVRLDAGEVRLGERELTGVPPEQRNVGLVFQNYALFPHLTVAENVGFGLRCQGTESSELERRVREALTRVGLAELGARAPGQLSGGQQQRVAIARALAPEPALLLLDEPLSNLDAKLRLELRLELRRLLRARGTTSLYVTHDQEEALAISDRIAVLNAGRVEQVADPVSLYRRPETLFVAEFVGRLNRLPDALSPREPGEVVGIRPEDVRLDEGAHPATVVACTFAGARAVLELELGDGARLVVEEPRPERLREAGDRVQLALPEAALHRFGPDGRRR
ncbi:MAG: ABC transporter ATP-binding protein [Planctomycetota bacterium]